jgi:hypothetical protein
MASVEDNATIGKEEIDKPMAAALAFIAVIGFLLGMGLCFLLDWVRQCP